MKDGEYVTWMKYDSVLKLFESHCMYIPVCIYANLTLTITPISGKARLAGTYKWPYSIITRSIGVVIMDSIGAFINVWKAY